MIAIGLLCSPVEACAELRSKNIAFTLNSIGKHKTAVFSTLEQFLRLRKPHIPRRVVIFDTLERLETVVGLNVFKTRVATTAVSNALNVKTETTALAIKPRNYIKECIDQNKEDETSFIHTYSTNLYNITFIPTRDAFRNLYLGYLNGSIDLETFTKEIQPLCPKRGKSLIAFNNLVESVSTDVFTRMQVAVQKSVGKSKKEIEAIAKKQEVAFYDLNYVLSSIK